MALTNAGPCSRWSGPSDIPGTSCDDIDPAVLDEMLDVASELLFEATGRAFPGECERTLRPCAQYDSHVDLSWAREGFITGGSTWAFNSRAWGGYCSCNRGRECGCFRLSEIKLSSRFRILEVSEVKVDGAVLNPSLYRVDDFRWLVRLPDPDGTRTGWPCCQDLTLPDTEDDTFSVTATIGALPPRSGVLAAAVYACELAKSATGAACRLPKTVQSIVRQGVSATFQQQLAGQTLLTGLTEVDAFLSVYGSKSAGGVMIPGQRQRLRRTATT